MSASTKLRRTLALALAGGSLAIGVPAALAATGGDDAAPASSTDAAPPAFVQDGQEQARPDREDCPERDGSGGGSGGGGSAEPGATTPEQSL